MFSSPEDTKVNERTNRRLSRRARLFPTPAIVTNSCLLRQQNRATLRRRSSREFDAFAQNRRAQNSKADCRFSFFPLPTHTSNSIGFSWQPPSPVLPAAQQKAYTASGVRHTHTLGALFFFVFKRLALPVAHISPHRFSLQKVQEDLFGLWLSLLFPTLLYCAISFGKVPNIFANFIGHFSFLGRKPFLLSVIRRIETASCCFLFDTIRSNRKHG